MPAILCSCGKRLSLGRIPCEIEWKIISDTKLIEMPEQIEMEQLYEAMSPMFKCPHCARLWVYWNGFQNAPQEYIKAADKKLEETKPLNKIEHRDTLNLQERVSAGVSAGPA